MKHFLFLTVIFIGIFILYSSPQASKGLKVSETIQTNKPENLPKAVFAGGCFWCVESEFRSIQGVVYTLSGYTGGETENPTYRDITTGRTGHAEATEIYYNPEIVSYEELLKYFFTTAHDPTQLNRQGVDVGTQYRSAIFYQDEEEKAKAQKAIDEINSRKVWKKPIVTTLEPLDIFYPAEEYHQQYYEKYERANGKPHIRMIYKMKKKALSE